MVLAMVVNGSCGAGVVVAVVVKPDNPPVQSHTARYSLYSLEGLGFQLLGGPGDLVSRL